MKKSDLTPEQLQERLYDFACAVKEYQDAEIVYYREHQQLVAFDLSAHLVRNGPDYPNMEAIRRASKALDTERNKVMRIVDEILVETMGYGILVYPPRSSRKKSKALAAQHKAMKTIWGFPEELAPPADPLAGTVRLMAEHERAKDAINLLAVRVKRSPWFIVLYEKINVDAPGPTLTQIWCCYSHTVIFYKKPWTEAPNGSDYQRWAEVDTVLRTDDVVVYEDEPYEVGTGTIVWYADAWWCRTWARKQHG